MANVAIKTVELSETVVSAISHMVDSLATAPTWSAYEDASEALLSDKVANDALKALINRQNDLEAVMRLNGLDQAELDELDQLQQACMDQPHVMDYLQAQQGLMPLFADIVTVFSSRLGIDFATACGKSSCSPSSESNLVQDAEGNLPADLVRTIDTLAQTLRSTEELTRSQQAEINFRNKPASSNLWLYFNDAVKDLNMQQNRGAVDPATLERARHLQRQVREDTVLVEWLSSQQDAYAMLKKVNEHISELIGMDFVSTAVPSGCCG